MTTDPKLLAAYDAAVARLADLGALLRPSTVTTGSTSGSTTPAVPVTVPTSPAASPVGMTVREGRFYRDGQPWHGLGPWFWDALDAEPSVVADVVRKHAAAGCTVIGFYAQDRHDVSTGHPTAELLSRLDAALSAADAAGLVSVVNLFNGLNGAGYWGAINAYPSSSAATDSTTGAALVLQDGRTSMATPATYYLDPLTMQKRRDVANRVLTVLNRHPHVIIAWENEPRVSDPIALAHETELITWVSLRTKHPLISNAEGLGTVAYPEVGSSEGNTDEKLAYYRRFSPVVTGLKGFSAHLYRKYLLDVARTVRGLAAQAAARGLPLCLMEVGDDGADRANYLLAAVSTAREVDAGLVLLWAYGTHGGFDLDVTDPLLHELVAARG